MSSISYANKQKPESQRLKEFGQVMSLILTLLSGVLFYTHSTNVLWVSSLAAVFLLGATMCPVRLAPIERIWLWIGEKMSVVITFVIVTLTFYLVMTPLGLIMRLFGADLLGLKLERDRDSYWSPVEKDGPSSRPFLPY